MAYAGVRGLALHFLTQTRVEYAGVAQKWVLVRSEYVRKKRLANFREDLEKQQEASEKGLWHLSNKLFESRETVLKEAEKWITKHPLFMFESLDVSVVRKKKVPRQGGFKEGDEVVEYYQVKATLRQDATGGGTQESAAWQVHHRGPTTWTPAPRV